MLKLLIIGVPVMELVGLLVFADIVGSMWTLFEIFATFVIGVRLIKQSGQSIQASLAAVQTMKMHSMAEMIQPMKGLAGGLLLCLPGLMTDGFALIIMLGFSKARVQTFATRGQSAEASDHKANSAPPSGRVIEGEFSAESPSPKGELLTRKEEP